MIGGGNNTIAIASDASALQMRNGNYGNPGNLAPAVPTGASRIREGRPDTGTGGENVARVDLAETGVYDDYSFVKTVDKFVPKRAYRLR